MNLKKAKPGKKPETQKKIVKVSEPKSDNEEVEIVEEEVDIYYEDDPVNDPENVVVMDMYTQLSNQIKLMMSASLNNTESRVG